MSETLTPQKIYPPSQCEWDEVNQQRRPTGAGPKRDVEPPAPTQRSAATIADDVRPEHHLPISLIASNPVRASRHGMASTHVADVQVNPEAYHPALVALLTQPKVEATVVAPAVVIPLTELSPEALKAREAAKRAHERAERKKFVEQREARQYVVTPADIELVMPHVLAERKPATIEKAVKLPRLIVAKIIRACAIQLRAA